LEVSVNFDSAGFIMWVMEKVVRIFHSHAEADQADVLRDAPLSPEGRIRIAIELRDRRHPGAAQQRLERVCQVVERERS
jgi:hypothetical protein